MCVVTYGVTGKPVENIVPLMDNTAGNNVYTASWHGTKVATLSTKHVAKAVTGSMEVAADKMLQFCAWFA